MDGHLEPFSQLEVEVSGFHTWGLFWELLFVVKLYLIGVRSWRAGCGG